MKTILFVLIAATSFGVSAQTYVRPQVINFGNSVQVQVNNTTDHDISCTGNINMHTQSGRMEFAYYFETIRKGSFSMRHFYARNFNDRIMYTTDSIFCREL
jgi:hypothetical protein